MSRFKRPSSMGGVAVDEGFRKVPRNGRDQPLIVPREGGKPKGHTRMTTYIDCLEDKSAIAKWKRRNTLRGLAMKPELLKGVSDLDPESKEGKAALDRIADRAAVLGGENVKSEKGTQLHELSEYVDRGEPLPDEVKVDGKVVKVSEADVMDMAAYTIATLDFDFERIEQFVVNPWITAAGTFDRSGIYDGWTPDKKDAGRVIADLKTGSIEYGAIKMEMQLTGYARGLLYDFTKFPVDANDKAALDKWRKQEFDAEEAEAAYLGHPDVNQDWGIIISLPAGSGQCELLWANLRTGWRNLQIAGDVRGVRGKSKLIPVGQYV